MNWQYTPYTLLLVLGAIISLGLALYAWRRRTAPGAVTFIVLALSVAGWCLGYSLEILSADLAAKIFWAKIQYFGIAALPVAWMTFALQYIRRDAWLNRRNLLLLSIIPVITILLVWTNETHGLIWSQIGLNTDGPFPAMEVSYGAWFWIQWVYAYLMLLSGTVLLIRMVITFPNLYRWQAILLLFAAVAPWLGNAAYIFDLTRIPNLDLTPFAFSLSGVAVGWSLFRLGFFDIMPVARRAVVDSMSDAVIVLNRQDRIVDLNPAACRLIDSPNSEAVGQTVTQVLSSWAELLTQYRDQHEIRTELVKPELGRTRHFEMQISPLHDRRRRPTGRLIVLRDITDRKAAAQALLESEERFRQVVSSLSDHVYATEFTLDGRQTNLFVSPNVEDLTGYSLEKFTTDWSFWPRVVIHPEDRAAAATQVERFAGGQNSEMEYRMIRADGQVIWVRDSGQVRMNPEGRRWVVYGVVSDITERIEAAQALAQARDQALEASRLKSQFLATVSHELRTPLNVILGFSEMLQTGIYGPLSDKQLSTTQKIIGSAADLTQLVNDILDQAHLETGKLELAICRLAPADLLTRLNSTMSTLAESKGLQLLTTIDDSMPNVVEGDATRLYQILTNLTGNGIKFTEQGQVEVHFFRSGDSQWAMQVSDTGPGIPAEAQAFIFDAFRQGDSSNTRRHGGSGLGLAITKRLVTLMGGQITVESEPGRGSTFTVLLPLAYDP